MRTLSADLLAAQACPDAEARVTVRCKRRGTFAGDPLAWRAVFQHTAANLPYGDAGVTAAACACAENGAMVRVLRSQAAMKVGVQRFNTLGWSATGGSWPPAAVTALTAAPTELYTLTGAVIGESTPGVGRNGNTIRVFYGDAGRVRYNNSANDGVTWGVSGNVWGGAAYYNRLTNFSVTTGGGAANAWHILFNGVTPTGAVKVRGIHSIGSGWVVWDELPDAAGVGWLVTGVRPGSPYEATPCLYLYLTGVTGGYSVLACQRVQLNTDGSFAGWDGTPQIVDRAGPGGGSPSGDGVQYGRVRFGDAAGAYLFALQERAVQGYWFTSSLYALPGSLDIEEPVYLGAADGGVTTADYLHPVQAGRRAWLVGSSGVYASAQTDAAANLAVRSFTPIRYTYTVEANGGGVLELEIDRGQSGEPAPESFGTVASPEVYVGDILWLDRTLATGSQAGAMTLAFRVIRAAYTRSSVAVLAADALGVLAHMRPRRPKVLMAGERQRLADVDTLCHWCGLDVTGSGTLPRAADWSPGFTWAANESGLGALRRYLMDQVTALRSAGADAGGDGSPSIAHTAVQLLELPATSTYTYVSPEGRVKGYGTHEIAHWTLELDSRQARLLIANGLAVAGDPLGDAGAKGWTIRSARPLPGVRPYPLALTDYNLGVDDGSVQSLTQGQAQWLLFGLPVGQIEAGANLGLELYDVVTVDQLQCRVVGIAETWERGRLRQRLALAEVNSFGVSVG